MTMTKSDYMQNCEEPEIGFLSGGDGCSVTSRSNDLHVTMTLLSNDFDGLRTKGLSVVPYMASSQWHNHAWLGVSIALYDADHRECTFLVDCPPKT